MVANDGMARVRLGYGRHLRGKVFSISKSGVELFPKPRQKRPIFIFASSGSRGGIVWYQNVAVS